MNNINDIPIIKSFIYNNECFFYDTNTNYLFQITAEQFYEIKLLQKIGLKRYIRLNKNTQSYKDIIMLIKKGLFKKTSIKYIEHPETKYIDDLTNRCINDITLQVTKDCNFKCRYCLYANDTKVERNHEKINMRWDIAKKSIDFLYDHSKDSNIITISFYGGEPLLNYDLIKKVVEYSKSLYCTKKIEFLMTINGSLLNDEIIEFIVKNNFMLTISIDGPENIQNRHRKFLSTGNNTFDKVFENILKIKEKYIDYFISRVYFLPVYFLDEDYNNILKFFKDLGVSRENLIIKQATLNGIDYIENGVSNYNNTDKLWMEDLLTIYKDKSIIKSVWHHNGPCVPGVKRLFIDTSGNFYPCEKFSEQENALIGNLIDGLDLNKIREYLNIGKLTENDCKTCWASRFCDICLLSCMSIDEKNLNVNQKRKMCNNQKQKTLGFFKEYIDKVKNQLT